MNDLFCIFTTGGLILWSKSFVSGDFSSILNDLIKTILMDEKKTQDYYIPVKGNGIILRWRIVNESGLIFVVAYQQSFNILYTDKLLDLILRDFKENQIPKLNHLKNVYFELPNYSKDFTILLRKWEKFCENELENKNQKPKTKILNNSIKKDNEENINIELQNQNLTNQNFKLRKNNKFKNQNNINKENKENNKKNKNINEGKKKIKTNQEMVKKLNKEKKVILENIINFEKNIKSLNKEREDLQNDEEYKKIFELINEENENIKKLFE
jgi:hypothetical protein